MRGVHLVVIAKEPIPGRVKTRLTPAYSSLEAASLAEAALRDTFAAVAATSAVGRTVALDGEPGAWLPAEFTIVRQRGDGLDERLAAAFADAQSLLPDVPVLLIGMDTPQMTPTLLSSCCAALTSDGVDAILGLADDGGWWAMGVKRADARLLLGVPMSTSHTGSDQLQRLTGSGLSVAMLPTLTDVDDAASAAIVAAEAPDSHFARKLGHFGAALRDAR